MMIYTDTEEFITKLRQLECHAHVLELAHLAPEECVSFAARAAMSEFSGEIAKMAKCLGAFALAGTHKPKITLRVKPEFAKQFPKELSENIHEREMVFREIAKVCPDWFETTH